MTIPKSGTHGEWWSRDVGSRRGTECLASNLPCLEEDDQTAPGIRLVGLVTLHCALIYRPSCRALNSPDSTALSETDHQTPSLPAWGSRLG